MTEESPTLTPSFPKGARRPVHRRFPCAADAAGQRPLRGYGSPDRARLPETQ